MKSRPVNNTDRELVATLAAMLFSHERVTDVGYLPEIKRTVMAAQLIVEEVDACVQIKYQRLFELECTVCQTTLRVESVMDATDKGWTVDDTGHWRCERSKCRRWPLA